MKISYQRSYPIGPFLQERIGFETEIDPTEIEPMDEIESLKRMCDEAHKRLNPNLPTDYSDVQGHPQAEQQKPIPEVQTDPIEAQIQGHIEIIKMCRSIQSLRLREKTVERYGEQYPELKKSYEEKLKSFE